MAEYANKAGSTVIESTACETCNVPKGHPCVVRCRETPCVHPQKQGWIRYTHAAHINRLREYQIIKWRNGILTTQNLPQGSTDV